MIVFIILVLLLWAVVGLLTAVYLMLDNKTPRWYHHIVMLALYCLTPLLTAYDYVNKK